MGSGIGSQRYLARWIKRLVTAIFRSKSMEVNFLPAVIF